LQRKTESLGGKPKQKKKQQSKEKEKPKSEKNMILKGEINASGLPTISHRIVTGDERPVSTGEESDVRTRSSSKKYSGRERDSIMLEKRLVKKKEPMRKLTLIDLQAGRNQLEN